MINRLKGSLFLLFVGIFILGLLVGSTFTMLTIQKSQPQIIPTISPTIFPEASVFPTGSYTDSGYPENDSPTATPLPPNILLYTDPTFGFSIAYPDTDFIKRVNTSTIIPQPVHQVLFYDKQLATSDTADLQPPTCAIHVHENKDQMPVQQWITKNSRSGDYIKQVVIGNTQGYKVELSTTVYPGEFYYIEHGKYIFEFIYCRDDSLATFQIRR